MSCISLEKHLANNVGICYNSIKVIPLITLRKISIPNTPFEQFCSILNWMKDSREESFFYDLTQRAKRVDVPAWHSPTMSCGANIGCTSVAPPNDALRGKQRL